MASVLDPFSESERLMLQHALKVMHETRFFERLAEAKSLEIVNALDSYPVADQLLNVQRLGGIRSILLFLDSESKEIAASIENDSDQKEPNQETPGYAEEPIFPYLESQ